MKIDFAKYSDGLVPAIVQDAVTNKVLMLGFMNQEAFSIKQMNLAKVTFYSRSKEPPLDQRRRKRKLFDP